MAPAPAFHPGFRLRGIIQLTAELGLQIVAEGVEQQHQVAALKEMGCTRAQGFFFTRPVDTAGARALIGIAPATSH